MSQSFERTLRELYRITPFGTFVFFGLACLALADPVTDILTILAFYREGHLTWFILGLAFVVLPCLMYPFSRRFSIESANRRDMEAALENSFKLQAKDFVWAAHPFSPALNKLRAFILCVNNLRDIRKRNREYTETEPPVQPDWADKSTDAYLLQNKLDSLFEGLLESAPHIIIQLYAICTQEESVKIIQTVSLPVSIVALSLSFMTLDEMLHDVEIGVLDIKDKFLLTVTQVMLVTSRLMAIAFFMVSFQWWITVVIAFHSVTLMLVDIIWLYRHHKLTSKAALVAPCFSLLSWLRDDMSLVLYFDAEDHDKDTRRQLVRMQWLSNVLFLVENLAMVTLVYFHTRVSRAWYALPTILCVVSMSYLGSTLRYFHFQFLRGRYLELMAHTAHEDPSSFHETEESVREQGTNSTLV